MKKIGTMRRIFVTLLAVAMTISMLAMISNTAYAESSTSPADNIKSTDIVVLYDNDVHCAVDDYANMAALKSDVKAKTDNVAVVSCGDFVQGGTLGTLSKGKSIISIMNKVGYDVVTLGNHEFDYTVPTMKSLMKSLDSKVVSCNFKYTKTKKKVYPGYTMKTYGDTKVAFVGISTPESITKSTPSYFQNKKGKYIYTFCGDKTGKMLYKQVQSSVNGARKAGADYVIAVSHLGIGGVTKRWNAKKVIAHTHGIDVMLDGHSHETYASSTFDNSKGKEVLYSQTGTKFANIGFLRITENGSIIPSLVSTNDYTAKDEAVTAEIKAQEDAYADTMNQIIGKTENPLTVNKPDSEERAIRTAETNLGDFCADAFRDTMGADVAIINGGGIRASVAAGNITYNDMLNVFPFSGSASMISASGQQIKDALELGASKYPNESGGFLQVAGMKYTIDSATPSTVQMDANGMFQKVTGKYRVTDVKVYNKTTKKYEALSLSKIYKVAGLTYTICQSGDGMSMFKGDKVLKDSTQVDVDVLINYIKGKLGGTVGSKYADPAGSGRIIVK